MHRRDFLATTSAMVLAGAWQRSAFGAAPAAAAPTKSTPAARRPLLQRGVTLYSYQEEYYQHAMTLEDCLAEVASMGATGVQIIAEEMVPDYPNPPQGWVDNWHEMVAKYHLTPTNLDTFVDQYVGGHRNMSPEESANVLIGQVRLAHRMGFKVCRPTTGPVEQSATDMVMRALPEAEKLDVRIAPEIHAPIPLQGKYIDSYLELIHKTGTKHVGFTLDCGVFCKRLPRVMIDYWLRHGADPKVADYVQKAYMDGVSHDAMVEGAHKINPSGPNVGLAQTSWGYGPVTNSASQIKAMAPYIYNIHGKFYEMTDDLTEYCVPYPEIFAALVDVGYAHSIDSEYEGQRWTQDAIQTDSCEQVRREHVMFRRLMGEIA